MKTTKRITLLLFIFLIFLQFLSAAPKIRVTGRWQDRLKDTNLTGEAGTGFTNPFPSATNEVSITITKLDFDTTPWQIEVSRSDVVWSTEFTLYVKVTDIGTGGGFVTTDSEYFEITTNDNVFITGEGNRAGIEVQYQIDGFSVGNLIAQEYSTEVTYTLTDLTPPP